MYPRVLSDAEEVAAKRWCKLFYGISEKTYERLRRQASLLLQVEAIARESWESSPIHIKVDIRTQVLEDGWPSSNVAYRIFDHTGRVIDCHVCCKNRNWKPIDGYQQSGVVGMFVCEHEPIKTGRYSYRNTAIVSMSRISRIEKVEL